MTRTHVAVLAAALLAAPAAAQEKLPAGAKVVKLEALPAAVTLENPFAYAQVVLTATLDSGDRIDATRLAQWTAPDVVKLGATRLVRPVKDGKGTLKATLEGQSAEVSVAVSGQKDRYEVNFIRDIMPALSRLGCNAGTCHGSAEGKNGFKLSLRGYDPLYDHRALTDDLEGRRFNRVAPEKSLMLLKMTGQVPHVGGVVAQPGEPLYELVKTWISQGVQFDPKAPRVTGLEVQPRSFAVPRTGMKQQLAVLANYSDGSRRDVTAEAFVESSNTEIATVDRAATVSTIRRGETTMLVRYEGNYSAAGLICMGDRAGFEWQAVEEYDWIDGLVYDKLRQIKVLPSELCTDGEFIRRIHLDLTGLVPEVAAVRAFLNDPRPSRQKREELIDRLIGSPDFVEHWTNKWADLLQVNRKFLGEPGAQAFRDHIRQAVAINMPYDQFAYNILTASGSNVQNPAASYYKVLRDPASVMENTTHLFLAVRFNCNKCHDHPFERWTQDQYYELAAYFAQVGRAEDPNFKGQKVGGSAVEGAQPLVEVITDAKGGEIKHERTGQTARPQFPFLHKDLAPETLTRREQAAKWITSKENPYFARSYVNRVWAYLLGTGIIEPIDDIRAGNPASNPKLLDRLTEEFIKSNFDVRKLMALICRSRTYQHSIVSNKWNKDDDINYARALPRRLPAEVLYDAIHRATGSQSRLPGLPAGSRAALLLDSTVDVGGGFFLLFGKPPRESACECERSGGLMLGPVLNLINGPVVGEAVKDPKNRLATLLREQPEDARVVEELYLATLSRLPTARELKLGVEAIRDGERDYDRFVAEYARKAAVLAEYEKGLPGRQATWEASFKNAPVWEVPSFQQAESKGKATLTVQEDKSVLVTGTNPDKDEYTVTYKVQMPGATYLRLELLDDDSLPARGPGRAANGNLVLHEMRVTFQAEGADKPVPVELQKAQADFSQDGFGVAGVIDNNPATGWAVSPQFGKAHQAYFEVKDPKVFAKEGGLVVKMVQNFGTQHTVGKFRVALTTAKPPLQLISPPQAVAKIFAVPEGERTAAQQEELTRYYRSQDAELVRLQREVAEHGKPFDKRQTGAQDLLWALINTKAFQFNH